MHTHIYLVNSPEDNSHIYKESHQNSHAHNTTQTRDYTEYHYVSIQLNKKPQRHSATQTQSQTDTKLPTVNSPTMSQKQSAPLTYRLIVT